MRQFNGRPATNERSENDNRRQYVSAQEQAGNREIRMSGEPAKFNTRSEERRNTLENDLYERQSI